MSMILEVDTGQLERDYLRRLRSVEPTIDELSLTGNPVHFNMAARAKGRLVAKGCLREFPGCCGIALSTGAEVMPAFRLLGIGSVMHDFRKDLARIAGYTVIVCTDVVDNLSQRKILYKSGFKDAFTFRNRRTTNVVALSFCNLMGD